MTNFNETKLSRIIARRIVAPADRSQALSLCTPVFCPTYNGVRAASVTIINPNAAISFTSDSSVPGVTNLGVTQTKDEQGRHVSDVGTGDNRIKVNMTKTCRQTYFLPHEVDLESNIDLMEQIKSDFGVKFKKEINAEILAQITAKKDTLNKITTTGELAALFGNSIATFNLNATGARPSIYKYDNGAPVTYISSTNQINVDQEVVPTEQSDDSLTTKDAIDVPAMYYVEKPTIILNETDYKSYVSGLCGGGIKSFVPDTINVDGTVTDFSAISAAILGDNSCFAVAFTEPKISRVGDKDFFADNICVEVDYGVELINDKSLFLISKGQ